MVALCNATDSKLVAGKFPGVDTYPLALGHENAGIVVAVGEKVRNFKMGDRVIGGLISDFGAQGINSGWGGFSEYVVVNDFEVLKKKDWPHLNKGAGIVLKYRTQFLRTYNRKKR